MQNKHVCAFSKLYMYVECHCQKKLFLVMKILSSSFLDDDIVQFSFHISCFKVDLLLWQN